MGGGEMGGGEMGGGEMGGGEMGGGRNSLLCLGRIACFYSGG